MMKTIQTILVALLVAILAPVAAYASQWDEGERVVDKGDLGKYWFNGKFLQRDLSPNVSSSPSKTSHKSDFEGAQERGVVFKSAQTTFVRDGKFVRRVGQSGHMSRIGRNPEAPKTKNRIVHVKGPGGKIPRVIRVDE